jgi:hypothetical protein
MSLAREEIGEDDLCIANEYDGDAVDPWLTPHVAFEAAPLDERAALPAVEAIGSGKILQLSELSCGSASAR